MLRRDTLIQTGVCARGVQQNPSKCLCAGSLPVTPRGEVKKAAQEAGKTIILRSSGRGSAALSSVNLPGHTTQTRSLTANYNTSLAQNQDLLSQQCFNNTAALPSTANIVKSSYLIQLGLSTRERKRKPNR